MHLTPRCVMLNYGDDDSDPGDLYGDDFDGGVATDVANYALPYSGFQLMDGTSVSLDHTGRITKL